MSEQTPAPHPRRANPVVARMAAVADALGPELCARVVFIGASPLPLLETEVDVLSAPRPTRDVDAVTAIESLLPPRIRHASAVGLLLLKCGAYRDRGAMVPAASKDLADIAALIAGVADTVLAQLKAMSSTAQSGKS